jgi:hypothetical protein
VQHALRAYTPREQKAVRTAAETFRPNPDLDVAQVITELGVGEALVSTLEAKGIPSIVQRTLIRPPSSRLGPITDRERRAVIADSPVAHLYDETIDRVSAFEVLQRRAEEAARMEERQQQREEQQVARRGSTRRTRSGFSLPDFGRDDTPTPRRRKTRRSRSDSVVETAAKSVARSVGSALGRALVRGILGSLKRGF